MQRLGVPCPKSRTFDDYEIVLRYINGPSVTYPAVIKADGLCVGKGVRFAFNRQQALDIINDFMIRRIHGPAGEMVIFQECLTGPEVSVIVLVDESGMVALLPSMDHKRLEENDQGPNTGGMGAIAPLPFFTEQMVDEAAARIFLPVLGEMRRLGCPFTGILYAGLILTDEGPKVLEFNVRMGDPECQSLMMLLDTPLAEIFQAMAENRLLEVAPLRWKPGFAACVVLVNRGYPGKYENGDIIPNLGRSGQCGIPANDPDWYLFHAGTAWGGDHWRTNGGRVIGATVRPATLPDAIKSANALASVVCWPGGQFRPDIGRKALQLV